MGAIQLTVSISKKGLVDKLNRLQAAVDTSDSVVEEVALQSLGRLVADTPRRYTGDVAKQWVRRVAGAFAQIVANPSKIMWWLEHGTKTHGPKTAKALFVPLNRRATEAGPSGVMEANAKAMQAGVWRRYNNALLGKKTKIKLPFVVGKDFVWAKKVRGIKARHIAKNEQKQVARELHAKLSKHLKDALK